MKKKHLIRLLVLIVLILNSLPIYAKGLIPEVDQPQIALVTNIIDGEVIQVIYLSALKSNPKVETLRMIGIDSEASDDTFLYVKNQLLGKVIYVLKENLAFPKEESMIPAYLYINMEESFNAHLLKQGLAKVADGFAQASQYEEFLDKEAYAYQHGLGLWKISTSTDDIININTASKELLMSHFNITDAVATEILNYRRVNPIDRYEEIGLIHEDLGRSFIENYRSSIHFVTSVNSAGLYELTSLVGNLNGPIIAQDIYQTRLFSPFRSLSDLKEIASFKPYYLTALPYISLEEIGSSVSILSENKIANINTATATEITLASGIALDISTAYTTYRDLYQIPTYSLAQWSMNNYPWVGMNLAAYIDRLHTKTDVNTSDEFELKSLLSKSVLNDTDRNALVKKIIDGRPYYNFQTFSSILGDELYAKVKNFIEIRYVTMSSRKPININTADKNSVISYLGLDEKNAGIFQKYSSKYLSLKQVNFSAGANQSLITLYTNINKASYDELKNMSKYMTDDLIRKIIVRRAQYPFYSKKELESFFIELKMQYIYTQLNPYIVFY